MRYKTRTLTAIAALVAMTSCIRYEIETKTDNIRFQNTKSQTLQDDSVCTIRMMIINSMDSFSLEVNNTAFHDSNIDTTFVIDEQWRLETSDTVKTTGTIKIQPHKLRQWNPSHLPDEKRESFLTLDTRIYYNTKGSTIEFFKGTIFIPSEKERRQDSIYAIEMKHGCPWYHVNGSKIEPIFQEISFNPNVENWN